MDAEQTELDRLYQGLSELEYHSQSAGLLAPDAAPDYHPRADEPARPAPDPSALRYAARRLNAARVQTDALARAEARLDSGLVSRVFGLASKVLRSRESVEDKQELADAMRAFSGAVAALRRRQGPPSGAGAIPAPYEFQRDVLAGLATKQQIEQGVADAADLLRLVRETATDQANQLMGRVRLAEQGNRAVYGSVPDPQQPSSWESLRDRADAIGIDRADAVSQLRSRFDEERLDGAAYLDLERRVSEIRGGEAG